MAKVLLFVMIIILFVLLTSTGLPTRAQEIIIIGTSIVPGFGEVTPIVSEPTPVDCPPTHEPAPPATRAPVVPTNPSPPTEAPTNPPAPTATAAPPPTATMTPTPTVTPTPTLTATPTATLTPPSTPVPTSTPTASATPTATAILIRRSDSQALHPAPVPPPTRTPTATPAPAPTIPHKEPMVLTTLPQISLSILPVFLLGFALLVLLAAERMRSALVAQTRQQRAHALSELALQRELHARQIQFTSDEALLAVRQVLHDALGVEPLGLQLVRDHAMSAPLVLRDTLRTYYALTPYSAAAHALARAYQGRLIELTPAITSLFVADELAVATRTLISDARTLPRSAAWYLVRYNPTPDYALVQKKNRRWPNWRPLERRGARP